MVKKVYTENGRLNIHLGNGLSKTPDTDIPLKTMVGDESREPRVLAAFEGHLNIRATPILLLPLTLH